jgi:membrane carboxypeptidase/penicillin-binding protein PbpC
LNIRAVKAIYLADINTVLDLAENLGYSTLSQRSRFGLSLVLGGGEVELLEHANAYSAFARDGKLSPIVSILKVEDKNGRIIEEYVPSEKKVLDSQVARMINSILSDNASRSFIFGEKNYLTLNDRPVAAKTGTTNDYHDAWTIGYTPSLVTGVWVGNSNNKAMKGAADGSVLAAPIWNSFMSRVLGNTPIENFKGPDDYKTGKAILDGQIPSQIVKVDKTTNMLATGATPFELIEERNVVDHHSILFYVDKDNPRGEIPKNPSLDPQFNLWEEPIKKWAEKNASSSIIIPSDYNQTNNPENKPTVKILSPLKNQTLDKSNFTIALEAAALRGISRAEYYLNNNLWQTKLGAPESFMANFNFLANGYQTLLVKVCDDVENCTEDFVNFNLLIKNNPITTGKNSLTLVSPTSNLALNSIDFPLAVKFEIGRPERVAQIKLLLRSADGKISVLKTISELHENNLSFFWETAPSPGNYTILGELRDWNGDIIKSNETSLSVN